MPEPPGLARLLLGSLALRPYVFLLLALYLAAAAARWGLRGALRFTLLAGGLAFAAEWTSTRVGVPFGLYHYTGATRGRELYLDNVPLFDPLSFAFLAFASLGLAEHLLRWWRGGVPPGPGTLAALTGGLMMWLDLVIDPLAVRGDRWFLGPVFHYAEPGWYFGVPLANFAGWLLLGAAIARLELALAAPAAEGPGPRSGPGGRSARAAHPVALYYGILGFNLALTAWVAEPPLLWAGLALHAPLAGVVVSSLATRRPGRAPSPGSAPSRGSGR